MSVFDRSQSVNFEISNAAVGKSFLSLHLFVSVFVTFSRSRDFAASSFALRRERSRDLRRCAVIACAGPSRVITLFVPRESA